MAAGWWNKLWKNIKSGISKAWNWTKENIVKPVVETVKPLLPGIGRAVGTALGGRFGGSTGAALGGNIGGNIGERLSGSGSGSGGRNR